MTWNRQFLASLILIIGTLLLSSRAFSNNLADMVGPSDIDKCEKLLTGSQAGLVTTHLDIETALLKLGDSGWSAEVFDQIFEPGALNALKAIRKDSHSFRIAGGEPVFFGYDSSQAGWISFYGDLYPANNFQHRTLFKEIDGKVPYPYLRFDPQKSEFVLMKDGGSEQILRRLNKMTLYRGASLTESKVFAMTRSILKGLAHRLVEI